MNLRHLQVSLFTILLFGISCTSYKGVPYFQDLNKDSVLTEKINNFSPLTVQPGDLLAIHVISSNHDADAQFNYNLDRPNGVSVQSPIAIGDASVGTPSESIVYGYVVDRMGNIHLPMIDSVRVAGLTTSDIAFSLQSKLATILTNPVVNVRLQNFKISVLGDVAKPGNFVITNEKITIMEALALAGDLNTTGIRHVLLVREIDGQRKYVTLDLTSKNIFDSPFYYLKNNDIIYVQPNKEKIFNDSSSFQRISIVLTVLSILAIVFSKQL